MLKIANYVISRAGSNSIFEFLELKKPMLLIPLSIHASRGDQVLNANFFKKMGYAMVLEEENLTANTFIQSVTELVQNKEEIMDKQFTAKSSKTPMQFTELLLTYKK